jgi:hypothetical protein
VTVSSEKLSQVQENYGESKHSQHASQPEHQLRVSVFQVFLIQPALQRTRLLCVWVLAQDHAAVNIGIVSIVATSNPFVDVVNVQLAHYVDKQKEALNYDQPQNDKSLEFIRVLDPSLFPEQPSADAQSQAHPRYRETEQVH